MQAQPTEQQQAADAHLHVRFYKKPRLNKARSEKANRPQYDEIEMIEIRIGGDKDTIHHAPANERTVTQRGGPGEPDVVLTYKQRFAVAYEAFKKGEGEQLNGTPLADLVAINTAQRAELKAANIFTIEALAQLENPNQSLGMHGESMKTSAQLYLQRAEEGASDRKLREKLAEMERALKQTQKALEKAQKGSGKKTGPPDPVDNKEPGAGAGEEVDADNDEVLKEGPFFGYDSKALREYIKDKSQVKIQGRPGIASLLAMAEDVLAESADA